ncbi:MAG TPA: hypothetical protein VN455_04715 [Methanotrichaceae archaeon]|nr:hypothetical protein [Methanotrichaceae archaeon]
MALLVALCLMGALADSASAQMQMSSSSSGQSDEHPPPPPWPYHLLAVATGFIFLSAGAVTAIYRKKRRGWLQPHKMLGLTGMAATLMGVAIAVYMVSTYLNALVLNEIHAYLGLSVLLAVLITPALGFAQFKTRDKRMHAVHRWSGRLTLALMAANLLVGIAMMIGLMA